MREHARGFCDAVTAKILAKHCLSSGPFPLSPAQSVHSILASSRHGQCPPIRRRLSIFSVILLCAIVPRADLCTHVLFRPTGFVQAGIKEDKE